MRVSRCTTYFHNHIYPSIFHNPSLWYSFAYFFLLPLWCRRRFSNLYHRLNMLHSSDILKLSFESYAASAFAWITFAPLALTFLIKFFSNSPNLALSCTSSICHTYRCNLLILTINSNMNLDPSPGVFSIYDESFSSICCLYSSGTQRNDNIFYLVFQQGFLQINFLTWLFFCRWLYNEEFQMGQVLIIQSSTL